MFFGGNLFCGGLPCSRSITVISAFAPILTPILQKWMFQCGVYRDNAYLKEKASKASTEVKELTEIKIVGSRVRHVSAEILELRISERFETRGRRSSRQPEEVRG